MKDLEIFKLEDRVLFEAAAAAEIVEAAATVQDHADDHAADSEKENLSELVQIQNVTPENPAASAQEQGQAQVRPEDITDVDALVDQLIEGEIPSADGDAMDIAALADPQTDTGAEADNNMVEGTIIDNGLTISTGKELVVINGSVADKEVILSKLTPDQEVLILEDGNGLSELNEYLDSQDTKYSAIHFVTHGNEGYISLNGELVKSENFDPAKWSELEEHLTEDGDILFYGCNTAANAEGQLLLEKIADATGADVAASTDMTGISGNWDLEYTIGNVDAEEIVVENFEHNLTSYTVTNLNDSGAGSLRQAVESANASTGTDEITFDVDGTIKFDSEINIKDSVTIIGNSTTETVLDGQGKSGLFTINKDVNVEISDMTLQNGKASTFGGAILNAGDLTIDHAVFLSNRAGSEGGAVSNSGNLTVNNSIFSSNTSGNYGGAVYNGNGTVVINDTLFSNNSSGMGGGVYNDGNYDSPGKFVSINNTWDSNNASSGGGAIANGKELIVVNNSFIDNNTSVNASLGQAIRNDGTARVINTIYVNNSNKPDAQVTASNLTGNAADLFENNGEADAEGKVYIKSGSAADGKGLYVWHNADYSSIAYSTTETGTKTVLTGTAAAATLQLDNLNNAGKPNIGSGKSLETPSLKVTTLEDTVDATDNVTSLREAVAYATELGGGQTVTFGVDGTFKFDSELILSTDITITGNGTDETLFDGQDSTGFFTIYADTEVEISGITFQNGYAIGDGGAIVNKGTLTVSESSFENNTASNYGNGGAIANSGKLTVTDSSFENNSASQQGGAVYSSGTLTIEDSSFENNTASSEGGAVYSLSGTAKVQGCDFTENSANYGGAICSNSTLTVENSNFTENTATNYGGAIFSSSTLTVENSNFTENSTDTSGGAVYSLSGTAKVNESTFTGNSAINHGGAIFSNAKLLVSESSFENNTAANYGGAIYNYFGTAAVNSSSFTENSASAGGAVHNGSGELTAANSSFTGNSATDYGGAISATNGTTTTVSNSTFAENEAGSSGGAVFSLNGTTTVNNSTFAGNSVSGTTGMGGAIASQYVGSSSAELTVLNSTFANNSATSGKAVSNDGNLTIVNSILVGNGASKAEEIGGPGTIVNDVNNLYTSDTVTVENTFAEVDTNGKAVLNSDGTFHTKVGGPAHENGVYVWHNDDYSAIAYSETAEGTKTAVVGDTALATTLISTDQRGESRTPSAEIGAYDITTSIETPSLKVTTLEDTVDATDNVTSLREAVAYATELGGGQTVTFGVDGTFEFDSELVLSTDITITGNGTDKTLFDGQDSTRFFTINADTEVEISGITFQNGYADGNGGAIVNKGTLTVTDSSFENNTANFGGAIDNAGTASTLIISGTAFTENVSVSDGGAVYNEGKLTLKDNSSFTENSARFGGAVFNSVDGAETVSNDVVYTDNSAKAGGSLYNTANGTITVEGSTFTSNDAENYGGAIYNEGTLDIKSSSIFTDNSANEGGAVYIVSGTVNVDDSTFTKNSASDGSGGAIYSSGTGTTLTVEKSNFTENKATGTTGEGGAIFSNGTLTLKNSNFTKNTASENGGAVFNYGTLTVENSTFTENKATNYGGAIFDGGILTLQDSSFTANEAKSAGAIFDGGTLTLQNSSFEKNSASENGGAIWNFSGTSTISNSSFTENTASTSGGAIYNEGTLDIKSGSEFTNNSALSGGAVYNSKTLTVENSNFENNSASSSGGAIYNSGTTSVTDSSFEKNTANFGGAIYSSFVTTLTVEKSNFTNNSAQGGGAIFDGGTLTLQDSSFEKNKATVLGGAIWSSSGTSTISNSSFTNNSAQSGGAIRNSGTSSTSVSNCSFTGNTASSYGGAIDNEAKLTLKDTCSFTENSANFGGAIHSLNEIMTISNSTFTKNSAISGGAIHSFSGITTISNSTFAENTAAENGGAILSTKTDDNSADLTVLNSTFANNSATSGKVVSNAGNLTIVNSILVGNGASKAEEIGGTGTIVNDVNNLYTSDTVTVENTFAEVDTNGKAVLNSDGTFHTKFGGSAHEKGVYIWHNDDYSAIAYSETAEGTKTAVVGDAAAATTMISTDQKGESRTPTTEIGSYTIKKYFVDTYDELKDAVVEVAANGGDNMIVVTDDITMEDGISVDIENDLNLTIKGMDDTIDLSGTGDIIMFEFMDVNNAYDIQITIDNLNFDGNGSADTAVSAAGVEVLTVKDSKVENFSGSSAIIQEGYEEGEALVIENTEFLNNVNTSTFSPSGGAVSALEVSVTISGSYFYNNSSMHNGGALDIQDAPTITIKDTTFEINSAAGDGGAANIVLSDNGKLVIDNSTFYQNSTKDSGNGGEGGALFIDHTGDDSKVTVTNSTFAANTAEGIGSAIYNSDGDAEITNTLLIGNEGDTSVLVHEQGGTIKLSYSLVTSTDGSSSDSITAGINAEINSDFYMETVFGDNIYDRETHTITPDAFHKAAWNGTNTGTGLDQLGNSREGINDTLENLKQDGSTTEYYSMGAVSAAAGLIITQGDYEVYYKGSTITPEEKLTLSFANGEVLKENIVSTSLSSDPDPVLAPGEYTITPSADKADITVTGLDADANVVFSSVAGTLTVKDWGDIVIQNTEIESVYGSDPGLESTYSITVQDKITGEDITLTFNVEWEIDDTVITAGNYSATDHINASFYDDSLTVKDFTVTDQNGRDMKSYFSWGTSAKSDLDVAKKSVTVTLNALENKTYNGKTDDAEFNGGTVAGAIDGESLDVVTAPGYTYGIYNSKNVADASYAVFTVTLAAGANTDTANYLLSVNEVQAEAKIDPAKLTVSIDGTKFNKVYDGTTSTETDDNNHSVTGIVTGDDVSASGSFAYDNRNADTNKTVTMSGITLSGADAGNYELVSDTVSSNGAVITPLQLDLDILIPTDKTYDGTTDVDSEAAADNILAGDDVVLDLQWNYNSANVNEATTITNTSWQISGEDAGNYILPSVDPYNNISASITGKETETVFQTSAPYYYDGTDQSGTISAYYTDINGNKVELEIDWNGQQFKEPGIYTVTVKSSDPNYALTGNVIELVMNEADQPDTPVFPPVFIHRSVPVYCEGLYNGYFSTVPGMQAALASTPSGSAVNDNIYTMSYPELVNRSMLSYLYMEENTFSAASAENTVTVDTLKYHPFTLDEPVREISESLLEGSSITHSSALYSGEELFAEDNGGEEDILHLFRQRSTPLSVSHDPMYMEEGVHRAEAISEDYVFVPERVNIPGSVFAGDQVLEKEFKNISEVNEQYSRKLDNMKSSLEKLLDEFCLA